MPCRVSSGASSPRAYLERYFNLSIFAHLGSQTIDLDRRRKVKIKRLPRGDLPDWIASASDLSSLTVTEAKDAAPVGEVDKTAAMGGLVGGIVTRAGPVTDTDVTPGDQESLARLNLRPVYIVRLGSLHTLFGYRPDCVLEINLVPCRILRVALPNHRQKKQLHSQPYCRQRRNMLKLPEHDTYLRGGK
ncbi:hypothetical protein ATY81_03430 [Rhizobium sp. R72]|nr:hypothetical protein ATY81_03430 [Rhizobium sp. R72]OWW06082.1 hypothetical protein ATY80_03430 [Rhizobium sp. R711]